MQNRIIVAGVVILVAVVFAFVFWPDAPGPEAPTPVTEAPPQETAPTPTPEPEPEPPPVAATPEPEPAEPRQYEPILVLPRLNDSDEFVRERTLATVNAEADAQLDTWLEQDELVRRFAVVVDNAADGNLPRRQLEFLAPEGQFPVIQDDDAETIYLDERGYARFDPVVDTVLRVEPARAASLLRTMSPLVSQALEELGYQQPDPMSRIRAAVAHALETPVIEEPIELTQPSVYYEFADEDLEALSPLQKQLLRMGPDNVRQIQAYLREIDAALAADEPAAGGR